MGSERDETYTILVKGKPLASVKADLIHAFLSVSKKNYNKYYYLLDSIESVLLTECKI